MSNVKELRNEYEKQNIIQEKLLFSCRTIVNNDQIVMYDDGYSDFHYTDYSDHSYTDYGDNYSDNHYTDYYDYADYSELYSK